MDGHDIECDIAVIGGGLGGVAAALAAARAGYRVCLTEETAWLGGQCTAQGVPALDEHAHIERFGGTRNYYEYRNRIRAYYSDHIKLTPEAASSSALNPGAGWVSRLCFEPRAALSTQLHMIVPCIQAGTLTIHYGATPCRVERRNGKLTQVILDQPEYERQLCVHASYYLDATELGDLLPLCGVPYVTGAESRDDTTEPDARADGPAPWLTQSFTYPFAVDFRPGRNHTIPKPAGYESNRDHQPYTLTLRYGDRDLTYKVFEAAPELPGAFWTYRRILAAEHFEPGQFDGDLVTINWAGNDYHGGTIIDCSPEERDARLHAAKQLSLGLLYWLQTEVPRDDGSGRGYPELRLRPGVLGTADGLSQYPYIRESRRIRAVTRVLQQDVMTAYQPGARAAQFNDSVGLGWYPVDIHAQPGDTAATGPTRPFQIPLGSLVQLHTPNLLPACKNLGVTHMTNGCYRLHPVEWNIGEAAARLAVYCLQHQVTPDQVRRQTADLRRFQADLLRAGVPLFWYVDLPDGHPASTPAQLLAVSDLWPADPQKLAFDPDSMLSAPEVQRLWRDAGMGSDAPGSEARTRGDLARIIAAERLGWHAPTQ